MVTKVYGTRSVNVPVMSRGQTWRRHFEQLRPCHGAMEDMDPAELEAPTPEGRRTQRTPEGH